MALLSLIRSISSQYWLRKIRRFKSCNLCSNKARKRMKELPSEFWTSRQWPILRREPSGARTTRVTRSAVLLPRPIESPIPSATQIPSVQSASTWLMTRSARCSKYSPATILTAIRREAALQTSKNCGLSRRTLFTTRYSSSSSCVCLSHRRTASPPSSPSPATRPDKRSLHLTTATIVIWIRTSGRIRIKNSSRTR